jgi:hypothetical protein
MAIPSASFDVQTKQKHHVSPFVKGMFAVSALYPGQI